MKTFAHPPLRVLVATPIGEGGKGGIDRIMDGLRARLAIENRGDVQVRFAATRGRWHIMFAPIVLARFLFLMLVLRLIGKCDLVHINLSTYGSTTRKVVVGMLARILRIPYVIHLHGGAYPAYLEGSDAARRARIRLFFKKAAGIVVLGAVWTEFVVEKLGVDCERVTVVPNAAAAISEHCEINRSKTPTILFLGKLSKTKGVPQLFEALDEIGTSLPWRAVIAGTGESREYAAWVAGAGLADRIDLPGWVGPDRTFQLLAAAEILVLPSFVENLPLSVIEGMAAGLAVVATPVGAVPDIIIHEETGLLVPAGDPSALATALRRLLCEPALRIRLGNSARAFHRKHLDLANYADRLAEVWMRARGFPF